MKKYNKRKIMMKKRRRFMFFMSLLLIITCCGFSSSRSRVSADDTAYISVYVTHGDTLWTIAAKNNPDQKDIRTRVHEIKKCNKLLSSTIHAGDELIIPV